MEGDDEIKIILGKIQQCFTEQHASMEQMRADTEQMYSTLYARMTMLESLLDTCVKRVDATCEEAHCKTIALAKTFTERLLDMSGSIKRMEHSVDLDNDRRICKLLATVHTMCTRLPGAWSTPELDTSCLEHLTLCTRDMYDDSRMWLQTVPEIAEATDLDESTRTTFVLMHYGACQLIGINVWKWLNEYSYPGESDTVRVILSRQLPVYFTNCSTLPHGTVMYRLAQLLTVRVAAISNPRIEFRNMLVAQCDLFNAKRPR